MQDILSTQQSLANYTDTLHTISSIKESLLYLRLHFLGEECLQIGLTWRLCIIPLYQAMRQCAREKPQLLFFNLWNLTMLDMEVISLCVVGKATLLHLFTSRTEETTQTVFSWAKTAPVHLLIRNHLMLDMIAIKKL